jgi:hypothetical protein
MKNFWKWIVGIVIVLVVVAALVTVSFAMRGAMGARFSAGNIPERGWDAGPMARGGQYLNPHMGNGGGRGFSHFGGFMPLGMGFMLIGGLFRGLVPLALLGLLAYGAYRLGKRNKAPIAVAATPTETPAPARSCANCGKPAQEDWTTCPYCGTAL